MICASVFHYIITLDSPSARVHVAPQSRLRTRVWAGRRCGRQEAACDGRVVRSPAESGRPRRSPGRLRSRTRAVDDLRGVEEPPSRHRVLSARGRQFQCVTRYCLRPRYRQRDGLLAIRRC